MCLVSSSFEVNEKITFHVEDIPFSTNRKFRHIQCGECRGAKGFCNQVDFNAYNKERDVAGAFLKEQDERYGWHDMTPTVPMFGNSADSFAYGRRTGFAPPATAKHWHKGYIRYTYYDADNKFKFGFSDFDIYCTSEALLGTAMAQFQRPDMFKTIVGIKVWGSLPTRDAGVIH